MAEANGTVHCGGLQGSVVVVVVVVVVSRPEDAQRPVERRWQRPRKTGGGGRSEGRWQSGSERLLSVGRGRWGKRMPEEPWTGPRVTHSAVDGAMVRIEDVVDCLRRLKL